MNVTENDDPKIRYLEALLTQRHQTPANILDAVRGRQRDHKDSPSAVTRIEEGKLKAIEAQLHNLLGESTLGYDSLVRYVQYEIASNGLATMDAAVDGHLIAPVLAKIEVEKSGYPSPLEAAYVCALNRLVKQNRKDHAPEDRAQLSHDATAGQHPPEGGDHGARMKLDSGTAISSRRAGMTSYRGIIDAIAANTVTIDRWEAAEKASGSQSGTLGERVLPNEWAGEVADLCKRIRKGVGREHDLSAGHTSRSISAKDAVAVGKLLRLRENIQQRRSAANDIADMIDAILPPAEASPERRLGRLRAVFTFRRYWLEPGDHLHLPNMSVTMSHLAGLKGEEYERHLKLAGKLEEFNEIWEATESRSIQALQSRRIGVQGMRAPVSAQNSETGSGYVATKKRPADVAFQVIPTGDGKGGKRRQTTSARSIQDRPYDRGRGSYDV